MEDFLAWYSGYTNGWKKKHIDYLVSLRIFLDYIQRAMYPEAPEIPSVSLLFKEDIPKKLQKTKEDIKFIPEGVLQQLEENLEHLSPSEYIPIVLLLRASGWRISDVLNLRYDTCLERTSQGWYLCGDITKTQVLNHRVPITDEVYAVVQAVVDEVKEKAQPTTIRIIYYLYGLMEKEKVVVRKAIISEMHSIVLRKITILWMTKVTSIILVIMPSGIPKE